jgi:hypothetical protein
VTDKLNATVKATIGEKDYKLRLTIGDIESIEEDLGVGLPRILRTWRDGDYQLRHVRVILQQALNGGGAKVSADDVRAMMTAATMPSAFAAVQLAVFAALDMGPIVADGEATMSTPSRSAASSNSASE